VTFPFFGIYGASKFAVEALTESFRYELSQLGVDVALVQPSAYPTPMFSSVQQPGDADGVGECGAIGEIPGKMFSHFTQVFQGANAPTRMMSPSESSSLSHSLRVSVPSGPWLARRSAPTW